MMNPEAAKAESFEGKTGQTLTMHTLGKLPAKRVLVVGAGAKRDFTDPSVRDVTAAVAQTANRVGAATVGFVLPAQDLVQLAVEGIYLGTYKFARYLTSDDAKRPQVPSDGIALVRNDF